MAIESRGLEGVVAAETRLSAVDGERGELIIAGFALDELASHATFEESAWLLWHGDLPTADALAAFRAALAARRALPDETMALLRAAAARQMGVMEALLMATASLRLAAPDPDDATDGQRLLAALPTIVAAYHRLAAGQEPIAPDAALAHGANYLYMLIGERPSAERSRALEVYLTTVSDHGFNASTFTARVIASTQSDLVSAVVGAIGALKGPLHGGAPGPALGTVFEIQRRGVAPRTVLAEKLARGERLMGFGHRLYRVRDPRADVLAGAAARFYRSEGDAALYALAQQTEQAALALLAEHKPERSLQTNVEFYTALLLHGIGLPTALFTPTFALGRAAGWIAHIYEQRATGRLIRPQSSYSGARGRRWPATTATGHSAS